MQDKAAIRLYSKAKIDEIIHILQNPPKTTTDDRDRVNKYYYCRTTFYLTATEPVQLAKLEKKDQDRVHPRIVVAVEDMFEKCMEIHKNIGYQGTAGMSKEANKFYYNITRPIMTIFLKYSKDYQLKRKKIKTAGQVHKPIISDHYNSRAQIDLVDMSSLPDNSHDPPYRYIVLYRADDVDLGAADAPNIVCVILEKNDNMFKLGHKGGVLKEWFPFNVLHKIDGIAMSFSRDEVPMEKEISVREAIKIVSISNGQGYKQCNCKTGKCGQGSKCNCYKDGVKCNSRCHKGENNKNCTNKTDRTKKKE
jgi:hypothetical protein